MKYKRRPWHIVDFFSISMDLWSLNNWMNYVQIYRVRNCEKILNMLELCGIYITALYLFESRCQSLIVPFVYFWLLQFVLTRIKYGPARYWTILFVFWFLVFGIWASRTHGAHTTWSHSAVVILLTSVPIVVTVYKICS